MMLSDSTMAKIAEASRAVDEEVWGGAMTRIKSVIANLNDGLISNADAIDTIQVQCFEAIDLGNKYLIPRV
jgi:hypothetical protein